MGVCSLQTFLEGVLWVMHNLKGVPCGWQGNLLVVPNLERMWCFLGPQQQAGRMKAFKIQLHHMAKGTSRDIRCPNASLGAPVHLQGFQKVSLGAVLTTPWSQQALKIKGDEPSHPLGTFTACVDIRFWLTFFHSSLSIISTSVPDPLWNLRSFSFTVLTARKLAAQSES